jgi:arsenate reductase (glutaredoxin)
VTIDHEEPVRASMPWVSGITVYEKPTCSTCRRVVALLTERGVAFERVDYTRSMLSVEELGVVLGKAGLRPADVVRMKEPGAADLPLDDDEAILRELVSRPVLLERPLVERGDRAVLARPPEEVLGLFD